MQAPALQQDFQKSAAGSVLLKKMPANANMVLVPQIGRSAGNIYVDSVWLDDAFVRVKVNLGLHIRLRNGGTEPVADCPVKVLIGQRQVAAFRITVAAGQAATTVIQVQLPDTRLALGRIVTEDTPVTFDNTYYFTLQPTNTIRVLEVGEEPLAQQAYATEPLFTYAFAKPQQLNYGKLQQANLVLVSELSQIDGGLRKALVQSNSGKVFVFAAPFDQAYSDFSTHALFVPVLYRLAMLSYDSNQQAAYRLTAPSVALVVPRAESGATEAKGEASIRLQQGKVLTTLAFNADRHESELATYSVAELRALIGPNQPNVHVLDGGQSEAVARYRAEQTGQPLWRYCLLLALACLLVEGLLLRFGRPKLT
nr:hypothetical protein [Tanacetum cinerariifolium]